MRKLLLSVLSLSLFCVNSVSAQTYGNNVWNAAQYGNTTVAGVPECADPPGTGFFGILSNPNNINIDWVGSEACGNPTGSDNFSTSFRMSRDYTAANRGWYDVSYAADDGIRISSDGGTTWNIVDAFTTGGTQAGTVSNVPLEGSSTLMRVDHVDGVGNASVSVTFTCLSAVAGVASISSTACEDASTSVTLTLAGYTGFIQWQESTVSAAGPYTDVVGATTDSEVVTPSTTTWYQAVVTSCGTSLSNTVQRLVNPTVTLTLTDDNAVICEAPFNLSGASPAGGFWSGPGVTDGVNGTFDPALAGVGTHTISYSFSDGSCSAIATDDITVTADITPPVAVCQDLTVNLDGTGNASVLVTDYDGGSTDDCGITLVVPSQTAFSCADVGVVSVSVFLQDDAGNSSTCTSAVTVQDVTPPSAVCQSFTINLDGSGSGSVTGSDVDGGSTDECGIASLTASPNTFNCGDIGNTTTTLTVTDNSGNTSSCTANLTVQDLEPPVAVCQNITIQLDGSGNQNITGSDIDGGSTDNCGISFLTATQNSFNCADVGTPQVVTLLVLDNRPNAGSCTATVTVEDNIAPTALCQNVTVQLDATGAASILAGDIDAGSNDACGIGSLTVSVSDFTCSDLGANSVVLTVEDVNGNTATCTATVEVEDNIDPVITCAADVSASTDPGLCSANVTVPAPLVTDNCGTPLNNSNFTGGAGAIPDNSPGAPLEDNIVISGTSGTIAGLTVFVDVTHTWVGDLQVTLVSPAGTEISLIDRPGVPVPSGFGCSDNDFSITFDDASGFSDADLEARCGFTPWYAGDAQPIDPLSTLVGENLDGTWILRIADNAGGDIGTLDSWALDVDFSTARMASNRFESNPAANRTMQLDLSEHASRTAADKANATPVSFAARALVTLTNSYNGTSDASDVYPVGTTTITWTATDTAGNTATCTQDVTVTDNEAPTVSCVDVTVQLDAVGSATVSVSDVDGGSSDNCGVVSSSLDITGFDCTQKGDNAVVLSVFDAEGNVGSCTATVTVEDNVAPMITCGADVTQSADIGSCSALVTVPGPIVMDNCDDTTGIETLVSGSAPATAISSLLPPTCDAITVPGTGGSVIDVEIAVDLSHTWISDLSLTIESPDGTVLTLADFPFCADDDLLVSFADAASATNADLYAECTGSFTPLTPFPATGAYQPQDALAGLIGQTAAGDWTLCITDGVGGDDGVLNSWSLTLTSSGIGSRGVETLTFSSSSRADASEFDYTNNQSVSRADKETAASSRRGNSVNGIAMRGLLSVTNDFNGTDDASGVYPVGTTPVVWTVTDEEGNSATCTQLVTVTDDEAPVALCQDLTVQLDGTGNATITAGDVDNSSSDNCAVTSLALDITSFNCGDVGDNAVILTAEDAAGNAGSCTATVTVEDNEDPVLGACPANITQSSSPTACGLNVTFTLPTATDNCAGTIVTATAPSGTFFPVGTTTVTVTATDPSGNTDDCSFDITIVDDVDPVVICPANITVSAPVGRCENEVSWFSPTASDNCPGVGITNATHLPGETFPVGTTTVTYEATDATGNIGSCSFTVTVTDDEDPVVTCTDITVYLDNAGAVSITEADVVASATDNCGVIDTTISQASFDCSEVGGNAVTVTVEDASGNTGTCIATVTVLDTLAPTALCQDVTVMLDGSGNGSITAGDVDGGSSDNCAIASLSIDVSSFTCSDVGSNTVTLSVTDVNGNSSTCTANVEVEDNIAPTASCADVTVALDGSGTASITAGDVDNGSSDNCGVASVTLDQTTFTCADIGSNTVTLTVTDVNGNTSTCTADVSVFDNTAPVVTCTDVTVYLDATGSVSIAIGDVGTATDNCSIGSQTITQSSFDCDETGDNDVIYNAIDDEGNVGSCTATVTVLDTIPPTITCPADIVVSNDPGVCEAFVNVPTPAFDDNCGDAGGGGGTSSAGSSPGTATVDNSTICDAITIAADPSGVVSEVTVSVDISHTWVGDLTVTLESPDGSTVTLLDRPGIDPPATCCGCSNDNLDIDFADGVGLDAASLEALCSGSDPWYSGAAQPVELLATFAGDAVDGDWTLCVSDGAGGDGGFLNSWSIEIDYGTARVAASSDLTGQRRMPIDRGAVASSSLADKQLAQMMDQARRGIVSLINDYNGTDDASDVYPLGTTTVTWTATDESGNTTTCSMDVTVNDTEAPTLTCSDYTFPNDPGLCEATISVPAPIITDNCDDFDNGTVGSSAPASAISNSLGVPTCDAITISGSTGSVVDVQVSVDISHTWIGDLDISLQSPDGSTVVLLDRPGYAGSGFGCSDDDLVIDFSDAGTTDAATLEAICDGNTPWFSGSAQPVTLFATLAGEAVNGDWTLCVTDNAGGDDGVFNSWSISIDDGSTRIAASSSTDNERLGFSTAAGVSARTATRITGSSIVNNERTSWNYRANASADEADKRQGSTPMNAMRRGDVTLVNDFNGLDNITDEVFPVGTTVIVWTATDSSGNVGSCTSTVTVEDVEPPVVTCQDITVYLDASGSVSISDADVTASVTDNCAVGSGTVTPSSFDCNDTGDNTVVLEILDASGNVGSCSATVTVLDSIPPMITCPADITVSNDIGSCSAVVSFADPTVTDNCEAGSPVPVTLSQSVDNTTITPLNSVSCNAGGLHADNSYIRVYDLASEGVTDEFTLTSVDFGVETASSAGGSQPVTVNIYTLPAATPLTFANLTLVSTAAASVADGSAFIQNVPVSATIPAGSIMVVELFTPDGQGVGNSFFIGTNALGETGSSYLAATSCGIVEPATVGSIGFPGMNIILDVNGEEAAPGGVVTITQIEGLPSGSVFPVGTTTNTFVAEDESGNTDTCSFVITVNDTEDPVAVCQDITVELDASGNATVTGADIDNGSTDNCAVESLTVSPSTFTCADIGSNTVTLTVTDSSGNTSTCTADVSVFDNTAPVVTCTDVTVYLDATGSVSIAIGDVGTATDNCSIGSQTITQSSFDCDETGDNDVIYNAIDDEGNVGSCTATVTVLDTIPPTITCPSDIVVDNDPGVCEAFVSVPTPAFDDNCGDAGGGGGAVTQGDNPGTATIDLDEICSDIVISTGSGLNVTNVSVDIAITHTWVGDLTATLESPDGTILTLFSNAGGPGFGCSGDDLDVTFDDTGSAYSVFDATCSDLPAIAGTFQTLDVGGLASFDGEAVDGTWTLCIADGAGGDGGSLDSWTLNIEYGSARISASSATSGQRAMAIDGGAVESETTADKQLANMMDQARRGIVSLINDYNGTDDASDVYPLGTTTVTWTATDESGNTTTCSMDVTVNDTEAPTLTCSDYTFPNDPGLCEATISVPAPIITDNCDDFDNGTVGSSAPASAISNSLGVPTCDAITISGSTGSVVDVQVSVDISHTWIGDLDISLQSPDGSTVVLLDRPGYAGSGFGCSDDDLVIDFSDAGTTDAATLEAICDGNTPWFSGSAQPVTLFATLAGEAVNGDWTLCVTDNAGGDDGVFNSWSISIDDGSTRIAASSAVNNERTAWNYRDAESANEAEKLNGGPATNAMRRGEVTLTNDFNGLDNITDEVFPVGTTVVIWTATDSSGNVGSCTSTVTVEDVEPPVVTCQDITVYLDATGSVSISDADVTASVTDNCAVGSGTVTPSSFGCDDTGDNAVVLEIMDASGNIGSCSATVTVLDTIPPMITCPADITVSNDIGSCSASVSVPQPVVDDNCGPVTCEPTVTNTGTTIGGPTWDRPIGAGPTISGLGPVAYATFSFTAAATGPFDISSAQDYDGYIHVYEGSFDPLNQLNNLLAGNDDGTGGIGTSEVLGLSLTSGTTYIVVTSGFGAADFGNFTTTVTVPCPRVAAAERQPYSGYNGIANVEEAKVAWLADNDVRISPMNVINAMARRGDITVTNSYNGTDDASDVYPVGTTVVTWTATDESGNSASCDMNITVEDTEDPIAVCQDITVQLDASGNATIAAADVDGGSTDNCSIETSVVDPSSFTCADIGSNTVTLTVTDPSGNAGSCTATVTVEDNLAPIVTCTDVTVYLDATGSVSIAIGDVGSATDNCSIGSQTISQSSFDCDETGDNDVIYNATDASGNVGSCTATVTVLDTIAPMITCPADITVSNDPGVCEAFVTVPLPVVDDNCGPAGVVCDPVVTNSGTTVGGPTWDRPIAGGPSISGLGPVNYSTYSFTAAATGPFDFSSTQSYDGYLHVYEGSFDPLNQLNNLLAGDDDGFGGIGTSDITGLVLTEGTTYIVVTSGFAAGDVGTFTTTITVPCPRMAAVERQPYEGYNDIANVEEAKVAWLAENDVRISPMNVINAMARRGDITVTNSYNGTDDASDVYPVGTTVVTWTATDESGNSSSCDMSITVEDTEAPVAVCQDVTVELDASGSASITAGDVDGGSTDNCAIGSLTVTPSTFTCADVGSNTVTLTVTDASGNAGSCTATVFVEDNLAPIMDCPTDIELTANNIGCSAIVFWDDDIATDNCPAGLVVESNYEPGDVFPLGTTTVTYTATDASGNSSSCSFDVTVINDLTITVDSVFDVSCNGGDDGEIYVTISGGTPPYIPRWSNDLDTEDIENLVPGGYVLFVEDANGCTAITDVIIVDEPTPIVETAPAVVTDASCDGGSMGSIDISYGGGTPPYTYAWSNGATTEDVSGLMAGTYQVTITDANGCELLSPVYSISAPSGAAIGVVSVTDVDCNGAATGEIAITVTGGTPPYSFLWSNSSSDEDLTGIPAGDYTVTVTDALGCSFVSDVITVDEPTAIAISNVEVMDAACNGEASGSIEIDVDGGTPPYTYFWSNGATTQDIDGLVAGTYTGTITDANGCVVVSPPLTIGEPSAVFVATVDVTDAACNGEESGSIDIEIAGGTGPYLVFWDNGVAAEDLTGVGSGTYSATIFDNNGCQINTGPIDVGQPTAIEITFVDIMFNACNGDEMGSIDIEVAGGTGPYTYLWSNGETTQDISGLAAGDYQGTITDANGCVLVSPVLTVGEASAIEEVSAVVTNPTCNTTTDGGIDITLAGGTAPYSVVWSDGSTDEDLSGVGSGTYSYVVTDANGCVFTSGDFELANPDEVAADFVVTDVSCLGDNSGSITVDVTGGTAPYTYLWSNGETTEDLAGLAAGDYSVVITDANGCTLSSDVFTITEPATALTATIDATNESFLGAQDGSVTVVPDGGDAPYTFEWNTGDITQNLDNVSAGIYCVDITDANGCVIEVCITVGVGTPVIDVFEITDLNLYPNPTMSVANLVVSFSKAVDLEVELVDVLGRVLEARSASQVEEEQFVFDVRDLPAATYFIRLNADGEVRTLPLIVQH